MADNETVRFEWDPEKEKANIKKHGLSFGEATTLFTKEFEHDGSRTWS